MGIFKPITMRVLANWAGKVTKEWDAADEKDREDRIDPDEPIVLCIPNKDFADDAIGIYCDETDEEGNYPYDYYHVESYGGGSDVDSEGADCGHDGMSLTGMEIDQSKFLFTGRRIGKDAQSSA